MKYKIGDKVVAIKNYGLVQIGMKGTVMHITDNTPPIGVSWNRFTGGHNLKHTLEDSTGYYVNEGTIKLYSITDWREVIE